MNQTTEEKRGTVGHLIRSFELSDCLVLIGGAFVVTAATLVHKALGLAILGLAVGFIGVRIGTTTENGKTDE